MVVIAVKVVGGRSRGRSHRLLVPPLQLPDKLNQGACVHVIVWRVLVGLQHPTHHQATLAHAGQTKIFLGHFPWPLPAALGSHNSNMLHGEVAGRSLGR